MKNVTDQIVSKAIIEKVERDLHFPGRLSGQKWLKQVEPDLYQTLNRHAVMCLDDIDIEIHGKISGQVYAAVWRGALLAIMTHSRAVHELWLETMMGPHLEPLSAELQKRSLKRDARHDGGAGGDESSDTPEL